MTILVTGDLHWNDLSRDSYRHDYVEVFCDLIKEHKVKTFIILGDITEEKDRHGAWLVNQIFDNIQRVSKLCMVFILRGNHDCLVPSVPFFKPLGKLNNVRWINKPTVVRDLSLPGGKAFFLPHTRDHKRDWKNIDLRKHKYVFTHNTFAGAKAETGFKLGGIPRSVFSKRQTVFSGDIHVPQKVGVVRYVGAPYPIDFGDDYPARTLLIKKSGKTKSLRYDGPQKVTLDIGLRDLKRGLRKLNPGDILKIRLHLDNRDYHKTFHDFKDRVLTYYQEQGCIVHRVQPVVEQDEGQKKTKKKDLSKRRSDKELLKAYSASRKVDKSVLKTGLRLMRKA